MVNAVTIEPIIYAPGEFPATVPQVYINDKLSDIFTCIHIEKTAGTVPGRAVLRFMPEKVYGTNEATAPNTLSAYDFDVIPLYGSRVSVVTDDATLFAGHLVRREDNGQSDTVLFTALDDREMLAKIPVRGAIVRDEYATGSVFMAKFLSRFETSVNPGGLWNCTGHTVDIPAHPLYGIVVPIFSSRAKRRKNYLSPEDVYDQKLREGDLGPWTPRRMLQYLWFIAHIGVQQDEYRTPDIQGLSPTTWRSLRNYPEPEVPESKNWNWKYWDIEALEGARPGTNADQKAFPDPLDKMLPPMNFQGKALLQAIDDVLTSAGTHSFRVDQVPIKELSADDTENRVPYFQGKVKSEILFFPIGYTAQLGRDALSYESYGHSIPLMRGGTVSDLPNANTAFDFQLSEDITYTRAAVLVEGDVIRTETEITSSAGLLPAWTRPGEFVFGLDQETAFLYIIWGSDDEEDTSEQYAKYQASQTVDISQVEPFANWLTADGQGGRQFAHARTAEAVQLARRILPRVFRAFRLSETDAEVSNALKGYGSRYSDEEVYPRGKIARPVLSKQLQFQLADLGGGTGTENWIEEKFPIRVQVQDADDNWADVVYTEANSLGEGVFLVDMAENYNALPQCIYSGNLYNSTTTSQVKTLDVTLKNIKMNIAFPMDHRVAGYAESYASDADTLTTQEFSSISASYSKDTGGSGYLQYIDSAGGYKEEHQVNSSPTSFANMLGGDESEESISVPLNRILPPGSEQTNAQAAAQRRLYRTQRIDRRSSWKMVGIRPSWEVGQWINDIEMINADSGNYPIKAPIMSIVHDFQGQVTTIGGLIGETF